LDGDDACPLVGPNYDGFGCPGTTITDTVTVDGKVWAQPNLFIGVSWDQINAVCPGGVCTGMLNGYAITGWTFASADDVNALFNYYIGAPDMGPGPDTQSYQVLSNQMWGVGKFIDAGSWEGTQGTYHQVNGLISTSPANPGEALVAIWNTHPFGSVSVSTAASIFSSDANRWGAFMYQAP
jgi:hypothetical protein